MSFGLTKLKQKLTSFEAVAGQPGRYVVAFSGGLDSTVLLHALSSLAAERGIALLAIHVDHGLQPDSAEWSRHCAATAAAMGVEFRALEVTVQLESGQGPEASAREARYSALHGQLALDDWLMSAHHREDQAETLLLNLVRGAGPAGIAGIGELRRFGPGWLARPLIDVERAALRDYAEQHGLDWIDDPSNADRRFDRNFLRHEVLPRLRSRWPDISARLRRSALHAGEAAQLLADLAAADLVALGGVAERLPIDGLSAMSAARQRNVIRYALRCLGLSTPTALQLARVLDELIPARADAQPLVTWPGAAVRRFRNAVYLLPDTLEAAAPAGPIEHTPVAVGKGLGYLSFEPDAEEGLAATLFESGLALAFRRGGEQFQPAGHRHTRKLKKLLQEEGVVPWMRDRVPLLYAGERLVAVGDLWLAAGAIERPGVAIHWRERPALH